MEHSLTLAAEKLGDLGPVPVTNTLIFSWLVTAFLLLMGWLVGRNVAMVPTSKIQILAELIIEPFYNLTENLAGTKAKVIFYWVISFFLFILTANWLGLFPGVGTVGFIVSDHGKEHFLPILRSINSDLNMTLALAIISISITHLLAIRYLGITGYLRKWLSLNPIFLFVGLLELVSELTKLLSLSLRLFGNIFAGEVVLTTVSTISPYTAFIVPIPFYLLELIVGVVQAAVFTMLTLVFMVLMTAKEH